MVALALALAIISVIAAASASADPDPHMTELRQHYEHLMYVASFPCKVPQPRVIPVQQLFPESERHGKAYFPDVTVLHRCDEVGCCTSGLRCTSKFADKLTLPFKVTYLEDVQHHKKGSWEMEFHYLFNETECACSAPSTATPVTVTHSNSESSEEALNINW